MPPYPNDTARADQSGNPQAPPYSPGVSIQDRPLGRGVGRACSQVRSHRHLGGTRISPAATSPWGENKCQIDQTGFCYLHLCSWFPETSKGPGEAAGAEVPQEVSPGMGLYIKATGFLCPGQSFC
ncbi:Hypothetical predicted protein [Marmota monax]|uniref:Uncharacterized protein n=1 Tax=Marmota monax TaxID=9995 RepID=A0A5E4ABQ9_MARMO|nr:hypothetical protein GHT09_004057 [Marmota monax]VTJ54081.1 Hypothetical predicted protein [Marmota monax]